MVRVAVIQIESTYEPSHALSLCVSSVDRAAVEQTAQVIVFPQLPVGDDDELGADGHLAPLSACSVRHQVWLLGSVQHRGVTSSVWLSPDGNVSTRPSSTLEQTGLGAFTAEAAIVVTPHGKIGLCTGQKGLHYRVTRGLALAGADFVCVSLALRSDRELSLCVPARALENQLFLAVAAHLDSAPRPYPENLHTLPPEQIEQTEQTEQTKHVPTHDAREPVSQIYAPGGGRLASGDLGVAELALQTTESEPNLTLKAIARRPDLYRGFPRRSRGRESARAIAELDVAALSFAELGSVEHAIAWASEHIEELSEKELGLVVLPELFCFDPNLSDLHVAAAADFLTVVQALARACRRSALHVVTTLVEQVGEHYQHVGVVIGQAGIVLRQPQMHLTERLSWATPGHRLETASMPWGRLGLVVGEDVLVPEVLDGLGRAEAEIVAAPLAASIANDALVTLSAAADEAGYAVLGATRPTLTAEGSLGSSSFVVDPLRWPVQRALDIQEVLRSTVRLAALRDVRGLGEPLLRAPMPARELAPD